QLTARTFILGMLLALADDRPAHLTRVHAALTSLPAAGQERLGVTTTWATGPHQLTYRQVEHTSHLITTALAKDQPDGAPSPRPCTTRALPGDPPPGPPPPPRPPPGPRLTEPSTPAGHNPPTPALPAAWPDTEPGPRPPRHGTTACHDPEASWGHRNTSLPG